MIIKRSIIDITGQKIELGHIVAVRYGWNSYVGIIRLLGLSLWECAERFAGAAQYHSLQTDKTYQILGHIEPTHPDFNADILKWIKSEEGECPIKIRIYENINQ